MKFFICFRLVLAMGLAARACGPETFAAEETKPVSQSVRHQVTGLFSADRVTDLEELMKQFPEIRLIMVDFANAEAEFEYDPAKAFPGVKPEKIVERFDQILRQASNSTFGIKPVRSLPLDKLKRVEIAVSGLDCKACSLGAYDAIYRLPGVETATASFKEGRVTALFDPEKIDRTELEMALKQRGVELKMP